MRLFIQLWLLFLVAEAVNYSGHRVTRVEVTDRSMAKDAAFLLKRELEDQVGKLLAAGASVTAATADV